MDAYRDDDPMPIEAGRLIKAFALAAWDSGVPFRLETFRKAEFVLGTGAHRDCTGM